VFQHSLRILITLLVSSNSTFVQHESH